MDIANKCLVGVRAGHVIVMAPRYCLAPDEAMNLAAWLIVMAQSQDVNLPPIAEYVAAVENT